MSVLADRGLLMKNEDADQIIKKLRGADDILIYGAKNNALDVILLMETLFPGKLLGCAVSKIDGNVNRILGCPVRPLSDYHDLNQEKTVVLVAMMEIYYREVQASLLHAGFRQVYFCGDNNSLVRELQVLAGNESGCRWQERKNDLMREKMRVMLAEMRIHDDDFVGENTKA